MLSHALYASFADSAEQRISDRRVLRLEAHVAGPVGTSGIQVHNLSQTGMLVEGDAAAAVGTTLEVELPGGTTHCAQVVWSDAGLFGCRFNQPLSQAQLSAALLRSAPQAADPVTPAPLAQDAALARLREHWDFEAQPAAASARKMPLGKRMWVIGGLGLACWAVPAAAAALLLW